jgi:3-oxoacyl-[acyl-carrier protein] reductase
VNTVSPGPVDTPLFREGKTPQQIQFIAGLNPQNRLGLPEEIAPAVAFLASPAATWINGQNILVNGVIAIFA